MFKFASTRSALASISILGLLFIAIPLVLLFLGQGLLFRLTTLCMISFILVSGLNLLSGTTGLMSLGHVAYYAIGAYVTGLLSTRWGFPFVATLPISIIVAGVVGFLVSFPATALVRVFFTVATLSVAEIINAVITNWSGMTNGPMGIRSIAPFSFLGFVAQSRLSNYFFVAFVTLCCLWTVYRLTYSYYGTILRAVREDDKSASAMGINVRLVKMEAFAISAALAGAAGCLLSHSIGFISPDMFLLDQSLLIATMMVIGGLGSLPGAVIGTCILVVLPEIGRDAGNYRMAIVGLLLFGSIIWMPRGILTEKRSLDWAQWLRGTR